MNEEQTEAEEHTAGHGLVLLLRLGLMFLVFFPIALFGLLMLFKLWMVVLNMAGIIHCNYYDWCGGL